MNIIENCRPKCTNAPKWNDETFWKDIQPPNFKNNKPAIKKSKTAIVPPLQLNKITDDNTELKSTPKIEIKKTENKSLDGFETVKKNNTTKKIDEFIENLRKRQQNQIHKKRSKSKQKDYGNTNKILNTSSESFQNRLIAQKSIIETQKLKLLEQEKIINDLKLGIITQEAKDALKKNKVDIRELFGDCTSKNIGKIPLDIIQKEQQSFLLKTQLAPKILQHLKARELERIKNREIILERKKLIEEEKKRIYEEAIANKKIRDEEEKRKNLEKIKQKRKEEMERMKKTQLLKQRAQENWNKAVKFHEKKILQKYFKKFQEHQIKCIQNNIKSLKFYRHWLLKKFFRVLLNLVEKKYAYKFSIAKSFYNFKVLQKAMEALKKNTLESMRSMQVAEDYYDFRLQNKIFEVWHRYVCTEYILQDMKYKKAIFHYSKRLLFYYFFQWKSLPHVNRLEKAKEERKQKWRQKVLEILPDYSPPKVF